MLVCVCVLYACKSLSEREKREEGGVREEKRSETGGECWKDSRERTRDSKCGLRQEKKQRIQCKFRGTVSLPRFLCFQHIRDIQESISGLDVQQLEGSGEGSGVEVLLGLKGRLQAPERLACFNSSLLERYRLSSVAGSLAAERREWVTFCTTQPHALWAVTLQRLPGLLPSGAVD